MHLANTSTKVILHSGIYQMLLLMMMILIIIPLILYVCVLLV